MERLLNGLLILLVCITAGVAQKNSGDGTISPADSTVAGSGISASVSPGEIELSAQERLLPIMRKKRNTAAIGSALFGGGLLISYGLIYPKAQEIEPEDMGDQLALISPIILASGLRYVGSGMACMRTSEMVDSYESITGVSAPLNLSWYLWFSGWGLYLGATAVQAYGAMTGDTALAQRAQYPAVASDVAFGAACVYSWFYIRNLGNRVRPGADNSRVSVSPAVSSKGNPGLQLHVSF